MTDTLYIVSYEQLNQLLNQILNDGHTTLTHITRLIIDSEIDIYTEELLLICRLNNLQELYIKNNYLTDIFPLFKLTNLTTLDVSGNTIRSIVSLIFSKKLVNLNLSDNKIIDLSCSILFYMPRLKNVDLRNNCISTEQKEKMINLMNKVVFLF